VVETDARGQAEEALQLALAPPGKRAYSVTLEGELVLGHPDDRLDTLANLRRVGAVAGLVGALRAHLEEAAFGC
jgi:hypothetical protein